LNLSITQYINKEQHDGKGVVAIKGDIGNKGVVCL